MLEFAILGLLKERPMHGYDLRKRLRDEFGALEHLSFGSLYPALARLEATGEIRALTAPASGAPSAPMPFTGSLGGERAATVARRATLAAAAALGGHGTRARKIYEITPTGEALFERLHEDPGPNDHTRSFTLRLAFARHLSQPARVKLLERQRDELLSQLERAARSISEPSRQLDTYRRSIAEHTRDTVQAELSWIDQLLAHERAANDQDTSTAPRTGVRRARRSAEHIPATAGSTSTHGGNK